jgi:hypothetical protein
MGDYNEGRSRACWICKFFVQNEASYRNGVCVRCAPTKVDATVGSGVTGAATGFEMFANVLDPVTGFCNRFVLGTIAPPATIPPIKPSTT